MFVEQNNENERVTKIFLSEPRLISPYETGTFLNLVGTLSTVPSSVSIPLTPITLNNNGGTMNVNLIQGQGNIENNTLTISNMLGRLDKSQYTENEKKTIKSFLADCLIDKTLWENAGAFAGEFISHMHK